LKSENVVTASLGLVNSRNSIDHTVQLILEKVVDSSIQIPNIRDLVRCHLFGYLQNESRNHLFDSIPGLFFVQDSSHEQAIVPILAAWQVIRMGAKILDDVEDGDVAEHLPLQINLSTIYLFLSNLLLGKLTDYEISQKTIFQISDRFSQVCLDSSIGQHQDILNQESHLFCTLDEWTEIAGNKTASLFAWACWSGALVSGFDDKISNQCWYFGFHLGLLAQIADDYHDVWGGFLNDHQKLNLNSLPICHVYTLGNQDDRKLLKTIQDQDMLISSSLQQRIQDLGTQKFMVSKAMEQYHKARDILNGLSLPINNLQNALLILKQLFPALKQFKKI
jgi:geranylgeranyl pyrophosphate synthase